MGRPLHINIKVIGDKARAAPYIALGKQIVAAQLQRGKKTFHMRTGAGDEWQLEVLITRMMAFITVTANPKVVLYTVNIDRLFENFIADIWRKHTDTPTRLGCKGVKGPEIYNRELESQTWELFVATPRDYPPRLGIDEFGWTNFRPVDGPHTYYLNKSGNSAVSNGVLQRVIELNSVARKPPKNKGESDPLPQTFFAPEGSDNYASPCWDFVLNQHRFIEGEDEDATAYKPLMLTGKLAAKEDILIDPEDITQGTAPRFQYFPFWAWSHDEGQTWSASVFDRDGFSAGTFTDTPQSPAQHEYIYGGMRPTRKNVLRDFYLRRVYSFDADSTNNFLKIERIFTVQAGFVEGAFVTEPEVTISKLTSFYNAQKAVPGTADAHVKEEFASDVFGGGFASHCRYNLGEGRMLLAFSAIDLAHSVVDTGSETLRRSCYAFLSDDYGATFLPDHQTWGDNCNNPPTPTGFTPLMGIRSRGSEVVHMNAACGLVLGLGVMWRMQFDGPSPNAATCYFSKDGGETWEVTPNPREGLINHLMVSPPVLIEQCASLPEESPNRGKGAEFALNVYDAVGGDWAVYYTKDSGQTWNKGHSWGLFPAPQPQDAARFRSLTNVYAPLLNGVLDPEV